MKKPHDPLAAATVPVAVVTAADSLGLRLDGIYPMTARTPAQLAVTAHGKSRLDPHGYALGASFAVPLQGVSVRSLIDAYVAVVTRFSPVECLCRQGHEALARATYVSPVLAA